MDFEILIIGSDINAYFMARCCHEAYGKNAYMIGKQAMSFTSTSKIINMTIEPEIANLDIFRTTLERFALNHPNKKLVLIGTNDTYVRLIVENREFLSKYYLFNYPNLDLLNNLLVKDNFYKTYENSGLPLPKTVFYNCSKDSEIINEFNYPVILKPGNGVEYYKHHFEGQAKVYKIKNERDLKETINIIKESGYKDNLIIQEFIPGDDSALFDVMFYFDKDKKAQLMTFAQIGLQEHTHTGVGNCTVLVNGYNEHGYDETILEELKGFLEKIGYQGFGEIDLKYDIRDGKYKVFEVNPRQPRCGYYLAACGHNLVKVLVDDLINDKKSPFTIVKEKIVLSFVPKKVIDKHIVNKSLKDEINKLTKEGKIVNPLKYKKDLSIKRRIYLYLRSFNYARKYKNNSW